MLRAEPQWSDLLINSKQNDDNKLNVNLQFNRDLHLQAQSEGTSAWGYRSLLESALLQATQLDP